MTDIKIKVSALNKAFGPKKVLQGVDLEIKKGESLVIIGGSGTGKSVLIKTIIRLIDADSGSIFIDGEDITKYHGGDLYRLMDKFGMLFQGAALFDSLPIWHNITFSKMERKEITKIQAKEIAEEKLSKVGLKADVMNLYPDELSGGMKKRVGLARAICNNPEIILFDEPTTGLDPIMSDVINDLIVSSSKELKATTITITHDMSSVRKIADRVAMIFQGKIIWTGTKDEMEKTDNPYVQQFINGRSEGPIII